MESLQKKDLNIVDALEALNGTVKSLQDIRKDDEGFKLQLTCYHERTWMLPVNLQSCIGHAVDRAV